MEMEFSVSSQSLESRQKIEDNFPQIIHPIDHDLTKRKISSEIDLKLGFNIKKIEETMRTKALQINPDTLFDQWGPMLHDGAQTWVGLDFQILQCTYHDLKILFDTIKPKPFQKVVDLGAGYGRMGLFLHWYYPLTEFLGIELVSERVVEANRIYEKNKLINKKMVVGDLSKLTELPQGDYYFIYDFGSEEHLLKILHLLKQEKGKILVIKGRICYNLMQKDPHWGEGFKIKKLEDVHLFYL
jgi:hypothetical protein